MPLTDIACKNAVASDKPRKLADEKGLYLEIMPSGSKYWRLKYRFAGKEKRLALGVYPEVSLKAARESRDEARKLLADNIDPSAKKKDDKRHAAFNANNTFKAIAREWHDTNKPKWTPTHADKIWRRMECHIFPDLGERPIGEIKPLELLDTLRKVEKNGSTETSHRLLQTCTVIFRYAIVTARVSYNPASDLRGALIPHKAEHLPTIQAKELPAFFRALEKVEASEQNKLAIKIIMLTFIRQGELRQAKWEDIDFNAKEWRLPAHTTKMRDAHIVPLCSQVITLLLQLKELTGDGEYLFPSQHRRKNPVISENTINNILHKMGYKDKLVGHGFRALASTTLNEHGFRPDVIERQLAHAERNKVRAAYNRAEYLKERREMMQWWANYVQEVSSGGKVVAGKFGNG